ncbi:MAG: orotate phosphoribosyltransferase [Elusimicrobiota bacterium]|jgi:orotate phosphoribosyltransferase|nr:orotate phosphoribosyltransferase [Elusimicrobiota bacterium]
MRQNEVKELFVKNKALLSGHFLLSSGLHTDAYFQSALILQYPSEASKLALAIGKKVKDAKIKIDIVVSPALGGIVIGQEAAKVLNARAIFTEKVEGQSMLRRGFTIEKNERVLIVEDVVTTGLSTKEVIKTLKPFGAKICAAACLVDRSGGKINLGIPLFSLLSLKVKNYNQQDCPLCKSGIPYIKPGSRK